MSPFGSWEFDLLNGQQYQQDPQKAPLCMETHHNDILIIKICISVQAQVKPKHKVKFNLQTSLLTANYDKSRVRPDHTRCHSATWICICGFTRDLLYISSLSKSVQGFWATRIEFWPFPLL